MAQYYEITVDNVGNFLEAGSEVLDVIVRTDLPAGSVVVDSDRNALDLGAGRLTLAPDGSLVMRLLQTDSPDTNVSGWSYWLDIVHSQPSAQVRATQRLVAPVGPFPVTADGPLAALSEHFDSPAVSPSWRSAFRDEMEQVKDEVRDLSQIDTPDALVAALVPAGSGSATSAALNAASAKVARKERGLYFANAYVDFFNSQIGWATGQTATSTTAAAAAPAGASTITVASATGIVAGMQILTGRATASQAIHRVASVSGTTVTLEAVTPYAIASGDPITPLFANSSHLGPNGYIAMAYWLTHAKDARTGRYLIEGAAPKIVLLGNSWFAQGGADWGNQIKTRIPGATVVNVGVSGNTSTMLLARFATDVPADADYVIFNEPGVNDDSGATTPAQQAANLEALTTRIRDLGAIPIYLGHVPLADAPAKSRRTAEAAAAAIGTGASFPALSTAGVAPLLPYTPDPDSVGVGRESLASSTATDGQNSAFGVRAGKSLTTGILNVFVGREAGQALGVGSSNVFVGHNAGRAATSATANVFVGQGAGASVATTAGHTMIGRNAGILTTGGVENTFVGYQAGYAGKGVTGNATTSGTRQTNLGVEAGQGSASQVNLSTAVGYRASYTGHNALAVGADTEANGNGAVAIGTDNSGAGAIASDVNSFVLGTALHRYQMPGLPTTNPGAGSGILWNDAGTVKVA